MRYTLNKGFRFSHEPRGSEASTEPLIGRDDLLGRLATRICRADGGAFLLVGYRGVGKTSLARAVVRAVAKEIGPGGGDTHPVHLLDLWFSLARPIKPTELLYQVVNGLRLELNRRGLLSQFTPSFRQELELAALRTAATLTQKNESHIKSDAGLTAAGKWFPKFTLGLSRERRMAFEQAFLPYDQSSAEQDVIRLAKALGDRHSLRRSLLRRILGPLWVGPEPTKVRLMFVFDELDKLEASEKSGIEAFEAVLSELKTLLTTSGVTFLFVGGRGLLDAWEQDVGRGDSIYQSVFSHFDYIPPIWSFNDQFWDKFLPGTREPALGSFKKYLAFHGRGVPRLMLTHLHEFVLVKSNGELEVEFDEFDERTFRCVAELEQALSNAEEKQPETRGWRRASVRHGRHDRDALALRYLTDWILDRGKDPFNMTDLLGASNSLSPMIAPAQKDAAILADKLVSVLEGAGFIELVPAADPMATVRLEGGTPAATWRVPRRRLIELRLEAGEETGTSSEEPPLAGRYLITRLISRGGRAGVYEAFDLHTRQRVALKRFDSDGSSQFDQPAIEREIDIMRRLSHEALPKLLDAQAYPPHPFLALELIEGMALDKILRDGKIMPWSHALRFAHALLDPVRHIHQRGVLWGDVKPSNILIQPSGRIRILDFGAARALDMDDEDKGRPFEGTLRYIAPECLIGEFPTVASEIYSLGVLFYQLVTGFLPFDGDTIPEILDAVERSKLKSPRGFSSQIDDRFAKAILRCLSRNPAARYQSVDELEAELPWSDVTEQQLNVWFSHAIGQATMQEQRGRDSTRLFRSMEITPLPRNLSHATTRIFRPRGWTNLDDAPQKFPILELTVSDPVLGERRVQIQKESAVIGRSPENEIQISDGSASRYHARIERVDDAWMLKVLNAVNITLLNSEPVVDQRELIIGSEIRIGETIVKVVGIS